MDTGVRPYFSDHLFAAQLDLFPGPDRQTRRVNAISQSYDRYDLVSLESIDTLMNCTCVDGDSNSIMESITIPFE